MCIEAEADKPVHTVISPVHLPWVLPVRKSHPQALSLTKGLLRFWHWYLCSASTPQESLWPSIQHAARQASRDQGAVDETQDGFSETSEPFNVREWYLSRRVVKQFRRASNVQL